MERSSFDVFKSNICHLVKDQGELEFIKQILCSKGVEGFNKLRSCKLDKVLYPSGVTMLYSLSKDPSILEQYYNDSIPEFKRFNIVENEIEWNGWESGEDKINSQKL